jgi:mRNA-degrading endonuclease toxin of MazEF toxin-antitoxin module
MAVGLNKFLHGSVWSWIPGERALIISNDEHNTQNAELICLSVSNVQGGASVCIDKSTYIQCNQIHMIDKTALKKFEGAISAQILTSAKAKISTLLNMNMDSGNLQPIRDTAAKLIGQLAGIDSGYAQPVAEFVANDEPQMNEIATQSAETVADDVSPTQNAKPVRKPKGKKTQQKAEKKTKRTRREAINYTQDDEAFVLDGNPSIDEIMQRFNFTEKKQAYAAKNYLRARRNKQQANDAPAT